MLNVLLAMSNKTLLLIIMGALIAFIVLLTVLGIVFTVVLRKRAPVIKVVMAPPTDNGEEQEEPEEEEAEEPEEEQPEAVPQPEPEPAPMEEQEEAQPEVVPQPEPEPAPQPEPVPAPVAEYEEEDVDDDSDVEYVNEGNIRVRYDKSFTAKLAQLKHEPKVWYSELKNALLSYKKVRARMSWRRESFRMGRMTVARFVIRGKTLCLLLAVEPAGYSGTKYSVEDVSNVAVTADTPCMYRIKNARRAKYAIEMITGFMNALQAPQLPSYEEQNFVPAYEETAALLEKGLIKRIETTVASPFSKPQETQPAAEVAVGEAPAEEAKENRNEQKE